MKVIVFTLNGCHLASLGPYGNEWIATPNLDQLAAESVVFDRHVSCTPDPHHARQVWLSGELLQQLETALIPTVLVKNNRPEHDGPSLFYARWSEQFDARPEPAPANPATPLLNLLPEVLNRLKSQENWLLWIDCDRLLPPWDAPQDLFDIYVEELIEDEPKYQADEDDEDDDDEDEKSEKVPEPQPESVPPWVNPPVGWFDREDLGSWELLHRTYAAAMTAFDADLGKVFQLFKDHNLHQEALWLFTADRGFPLGEHGIIGPHRPWLHEELVHLPLIIRPRGQHFGKRVAAITQPADLPSTIADCFQLQNNTGASLLPWLGGLNGPSREFALSKFGDEQAIRTPDWTLLKPGKPHPDDAEDDPREVQLYSMPEDRWEVNDLWRQQEAVVEELLGMLESPGGSHGTDNTG